MPATEEDILRQSRSLLVAALGLEALLLAPVTLSRVRAAASCSALVELVWEIERSRARVIRSQEQVLNLQRARDLLGMGNTLVAEDLPMPTQWPDTQPPGA